MYATRFHGTDGQVVRVALALHAAAEEGGMAVVAPTLRMAFGDEVYGRGLDLFEASDYDRGFLHGRCTIGVARVTTMGPGRYYVTLGSAVAYVVKGGELFSIQWQSNYHYGRSLAAAVARFVMAHSVDAFVMDLA